MRYKSKAISTRNKKEDSYSKGKDTIHDLSTIYLNLLDDIALQCIKLVGQWREDEDNDNKNFEDIKELENKFSEVSLLKVPLLSSSSRNAIQKANPSLLHQPKVLVKKNPTKVTNLISNLE